MQLAAFFRIVREDPKIRETHTVVRHVSGEGQAEESAAQGG